MSYDVHPVADLFPMLADDELGELAEDIEQRGLLQPIVLDPQGRVLDGRNRLAACRLAGVEPEFVTYGGDDPDGYALAVNIARRHLSKGQKAMVLALADLDNNYQDHVSDVSRQYVSWARTVSEHAPDLAGRVVEGTMPLKSAYDEALQRKQDKDTARAKLDRLRSSATDLASLVDEERMSLDDGIALLDAREEKDRQEEDARLREERERQQAELDRRHRHSRSFGESLVALWSFLNPDPAGFVEKTWLADANPHRTTPGAKDAFTEKGLRLLSARLDALADHINKSGGTL